MDILINIITNPSFWFGVIRSTTPILLAALSALVAERAGITNMAVEGIMLFSALFSVLGSHFTGSPWLGLLVGILIGIIIGLLLAYFRLKMKADEILAGLAINMLAAGGTVFMLYTLTGEKSTSASLGNKVLPIVRIPLIKDIPFLGRVISGHGILVYLAIVLVFVLNYMLFKTPLGLRIRSVGSNPDAAKSVGVSADKIRFIALAISGALAGIAGAYMSMGYMKFFVKGMVAGRGFVGLAANYVAGMHPIGALFSSLLFGLFEALANNLQSLVKIPVEFIQMIPYLTTIIVYSTFSYRRYMQKNKKRTAVKEQDPAKVSL